MYNRTNVSFHNSPNSELRENIPSAALTIIYSEGLTVQTASIPYPAHLSDAFFCHNLSDVRGESLSDSITPYKSTSIIACNSIAFINVQHVRETSYIERCLVHALSRLNENFLYGCERYIENHDCPVDSEVNASRSLQYTVHHPFFAKTGSSLSTITCSVSRAFV